jgi:FAD:protein FMN transferase
VLLERRLGALLPVLLTALCLPCHAQDSRPADGELVLRERRLSVMGTELQIEVLGSDVATLDAALDAAIVEIKRVEDVFTTWRPSPLNRLNKTAGQGPQECSAEVIQLVSRSLELGRLTGGAFDVTFWGVGRLWNTKRKPPTVPTAEEVKEALKLVDFRRVEVNDSAKTITVPTGMSIGLGGIAKGYGVDQAMHVLMKRGVKHAMVNAGGDLKALGRKHGKPWEIALRHPRDRERVLAVLPVSNLCVVTSGDYEKFFIHDGKRYHHIIDARTGFPSTGCMSATVVAPDAAFADGLATALCVMGPKEGLELVNRIKRVEALLVSQDGKVYTSAGLPASLGR